MLDGFRYAQPILQAESAQLPPRRDRQRPDDLVAADHHHLVHHVDDHADVVRHDPHHVADIGAGVAARKIEKAVFFGKARDFRLGMFENEAIAASVTCRLAKQTMGRVWRRASRSSAQRR